LIKWIQKNAEFRKDVLNWPNYTIHIDGIIHCRNFIYQQLARGKPIQAAYRLCDMICIHERHGKLTPTDFLFVSVTKQDF
jgi:hypothetical protein